MATSDKTATAPHLLVVIDHQEARVYRTEVHGAVPERIVPYDPHGYGKHLHSAHEWTDGKRQPERKSFYEAVAKTLARGRAGVAVRERHGPEQCDGHAARRLEGPPPRRGRKDRRVGRRGRPPHDRGPTARQGQGVLRRVQQEVTRRLWPTESTFMDGSHDDLDRVVRLAGEAVVDARPGDHQPDLDDPLPGHPRQLRVRLRASRSEEAAGESGRPVRHQPRGEPAVHADLRRAAERPAGGGGHRDRVGDVVWCVVAVWPHYRWVAVAQVPYFVWVSIATVLQLSITAMNW